MSQNKYLKSKLNKSPNVSLRSKDSDKRSEVSLTPPIQEQPTERQPTPIICTPGLEYLLVVDQMLIKQKVELFEGLFNF